MQLTSQRKRVISGLSLLAVLGLCLYLGGWPLRVFICLAGVLALWEFYQMIWPGRLFLPDKAVGLACAALLCLVSGRAALAGLLLYAATRFLLRYGRSEPPAEPVAESADGQDAAEAPGRLPDPAVNLADPALLVFGLVYLPFALSMALDLNLLDQLAVLLAVVASDTGAYYAGSLLGKHKIWPKVSPKKSVEGALGGLLASVVLLTAFGLFIYGARRPEDGLTALDWALSGLLLSAAAQTGDFFESALKRWRGVKDSSNLIPGHGGVMDRLDSLVFALPIYLFVCRPLMLAF